MIDYKDVFDKEIDAIEKLKDSIDNTVFNYFVQQIISCKGRVVWTGMGKSGNICQKIVSTMQSLGIKAFFVHPSEALHGGLGVLDKNDLVIAVSNSGETDEILELMPRIVELNVTLLGIIGRKNSTLERYSQSVIIFPAIEEAYLGTVVPTSSTTATLVLGDALAIAAAQQNGFTEKEFGRYHPKGTLGRRLTLTVEQIMVSEEENAVVSEEATVEQALFEMCNKAISGVNIVSSGGALLGILTDGDFRRLYNANQQGAFEMQVKYIMTKTPTMFSSTELVYDVIQKVKALNKGYSFFPVVDQGKLKGSLRMIDLINSGLMS